MTCAECGEEADEMAVVNVGGKRKRLCEDCAEEAQHEQEIAAEAESAMQGMMEYKGR